MFYLLHKPLNHFKFYPLFVYFSLIFNILCSQSVDEINKFREQYDKLLDKVSSKNNVNNDLQQFDQDKSELTILNSYEIDNDLKDGEQKYFFGYDFFSERDSIPFWNNLPVLNNYLLGPGDELIISLWGETQLRKIYEISRDGTIYDDKVGLLFLSDKNLKEAEKYLTSQFSRVYSTLNKKPQSTFFNLSMGKLKSINVRFIGFVNYPGVHPVHPFSTVIAGLYQAGGVDTTGSLRNIKLIRSNETFNLDLYDFLLNGNVKSDFQLRDQDIVLVPSRKSYVEIDKGVLRPGVYESIKSETIYDLIEIAGGKSRNSSNIISIFNENAKVDNERLNIYDSKYVNIEQSKSISIFSNGKISILNNKKELYEVEILGNVKMPGKYNFEENMTLSELFSMVSGFEDSTFLKSVNLLNAEIIRKNPSKNFSEVINFKIPEVLDGTLDFKLSNLDKIVIHENRNFIDKKYVKIFGEVEIPGEYPLIYNDESLYSIITRSGGLTPTASQKGIEVYRDSLRVAWENLAIPIMPGDSIIVNKKTKTVFVTGEVYNPGLVEFKKSKSYKYYLDLVGGPTKNGDMKDIIVVYPNGEVVPIKKLKLVRIFDGSTIIVNKKQIVKPFDLTALANSTLSFVSSIFTIIVLSQQIN